MKSPDANSYMAMEGARAGLERCSYGNLSHAAGDVNQYNPLSHRNFPRREGMSDGQGCVILIVHTSLSGLSKIRLNDLRKIWM